eukprot:349873-Chlamydomonas_euryale.AAC.4
MCGRRSVDGVRSVAAHGGLQWQWRPRTLSASPCTLSTSHPTPLLQGCAELTAQYRALQDAFDASGLDGEAVEAVRVRHRAPWALLASLFLRPAGRRDSSGRPNLLHINAVQARVQRPKP